MTHPILIVNLDKNVDPVNPIDAAEIGSILLDIGTSSLP